MTEVPDHLLNDLIHLAQKVNDHANSLLIPHTPKWDDELEDIYELAHKTLNKNI